MYKIYRRTLKFEKRNTRVFKVIAVPMYLSCHCIKKKHNILLLKLLPGYMSIIAWYSHEFDISHMSILFTSVEPIL